MAEKRFTFDDLEAHIKNRSIAKAAVDRLQKTIKVDSGKLDQLKKELSDAESNLSKEERLLKEILTDITK